MIKDIRKQHLLLKTIMDYFNDFLLEKNSSERFWALFSRFHTWDFSLAKKSFEGKTIMDFKKSFWALGRALKLISFWWTVMIWSTQPYLANIFWWCEWHWAAFLVYIEKLILTLTFIDFFSWLFRSKIHLSLTKNNIYFLF